MRFSGSYFPPTKGFSLVEVLVTVAVLGLLASMALLDLSGARRKSVESKLSLDAATLNRAVNAYRATSGAFPDGADASLVLAKLKSEATAESAARLPGFSGSFLDARAVAVYMDAAEASTNAPRLLWDDASQQFVVARTGGPGIKRIDLGDGSGPRTTEDRRAPLSYASEGGWIWDYEDKELPPPPAPSEFVLVEDPPDSPTPGGGGSEPPPMPIPKASLATPLAAPGSGTYAASAYPLPLDVTDPNAENLAQIWYSLDFGEWKQVLAGALAVPAGTQVVKLQSVPLNPEVWEASPLATLAFEVSPSQLLPPNIVPSAGSFVPISLEQIEVTLQNPNDPTLSSLRYRIASGDWVEYHAPFTTTLAEFPVGYRIDAMAVPVSPYWTASDPAEETVGGQNLGAVLSLGVEIDVDAGAPVFPAGSFVTLRDGHWHDPATWRDGVTPGANLSGKTVVVRHRVGFGGGTLEIGSGSLEIEGVLLIDNQNVKLGHRDGRVALRNGLVIVDNGNFEVEDGLAEFGGGAVQICNGNYVNKESSRGTLGSGTIFVYNGGIDRVGSSPFSEDIAWAAPFGSGTNLPTPENPALATPPGGCRDETGFGGAVDRNAAVTFRFTNAAGTPLQVSFLSVLPDDLRWDGSEAPSLSGGLVVDGFAIRDGGLRALAERIELPPGESSITLRALSSAMDGTYTIETEVRAESAGAPVSDSTTFAF